MFLNTQLQDFICDVVYVFLQTLSLEFGLQCSGIAQSGCTDGLCLNGGSCITTPGYNEVFCLCSSGFTGERCESELEQCLRIEGSLFPSNTHTVLWEGLYEGFPWPHLHATRDLPHHLSTPYVRNQLHLVAHGSTTAHARLTLLPLEPDPQRKLQELPVHTTDTTIIMSQYHQ